MKSQTTVWDFYFYIYKFILSKEMSLTSFINERLKINKEYVDVHTEKPTTVRDLEQIIKNRFDKLGTGTIKEPINLNDIDGSEIDDFTQLFCYIGFNYKIKAILILI